MLKNKLSIFVGKRALILFVLLASLNVIIMPQRWLILSGMFTGGVFGILKFDRTALVYSSLLSPGQCSRGTAAGAIFFVIYQILTIGFLALAVYLNLWYFCGALTGILIIPLVIMINSITEALGITHNHFE